MFLKLALSITCIIIQCVFIKFLACHCFCHFDKFVKKKCFAIVYIPILQICIWQLTAPANIHPHLCAHTYAHTHHITVMTIPYVLLLRQKATTVIIKQNVTSAVTLLKPLAKLIIEQRSNSQTLLLSDTHTLTRIHKNQQITVTLNSNVSLHEEE